MRWWAEHPEACALAERKLLQFDRLVAAIVAVGLTFATMGTWFLIATWDWK